MKTLGRITIDGDRAYPYIGVALGLGVSVAANIINATSEAGPAPIFAIILAGFWPVATFLSLEILARIIRSRVVDTTPRPGGWRGAVDLVRRVLGLIVACTGVAIVAAVTAVISYQHLHDLIATYGESDLSATIGPLGPDGLMATSAVAILTRTRRVKATEGAVAEGAHAVEAAAPDPAATSGARDKTHLTPDSRGVGATAAPTTPASEPVQPRTAEEASGTGEDRDDATAAPRGSGNGCPADCTSCRDLRKVLDAPGDPISKSEAARQLGWNIKTVRKHWPADDEGADVVHLRATAAS